MAEPLSRLSGHDIARSFDIFDSRFDDPEEFDVALQRLRSECPVSWSEKHGGFWVVSDYENVANVLRDPAKFSSHQLNVPRFADPMGGSIPQHEDAPDHELYRSSLNVLMTNQRVKRFEPRAAELAGGMWQSMLAAGGGELVTDFAVPYVSTVALEYLGFPTADLYQLRTWMYDLVHRAQGPDEQERQDVELNVRPAVVEYLNRLLDERENAESPPDDVISGIAMAKRGDRPFTRNEQLRALMLFMVAGLDTTTNLLGASLWYLAENRSKFEELVDNPSLIASAVEELGRYFNITHFSRECVEATELGGQRIEAGQMVSLVMSSTGRDEKFYADPQIDFARTSRRHLTFGAGPHRCIGSHLARMSMRVAIEQLIAIVPSMTLTRPDEVVWTSCLARAISNVNVAISEA